MRDTEYIALEVPVFALMIGAELIISRRQGRKAYRLDAAISDLSCGLTQQVTGIFARALVFGAYVWAYRKLSLFTLPQRSPFTWALAFFGVDFLYYWFHRFGHEINLLWAVHVVHHQSEEYNFAVALRQTWFSDFTGVLFYWPMPLLGVPLEAFLAAASLLAIYQTWLHTSTVGDLGWFGFVFNTPSHHRVHHGRDAKYLDKNYGATLIVWDRIFGTFQREEETPCYGISRPLDSFNPLWAQVATFAELTRLTRATKGYSQKLALWFRHPADQVSVAEPAAPRHYSFGISVYVVAQFILTLFAASALIYFSDRLPAVDVAVFTILILIATVVWSGLFENKRWAWPLELARLSAVAVFVAGRFAWTA